MTDKAKLKRQTVGSPRNVRISDSDWALLNKWARQVGAEAGVPITVSQIIRKLIDEEKQRQANSKEVVQQVGTAL